MLSQNLLLVFPDSSEVFYSLEISFNRGFNGPYKHTLPERRDGSGNPLFL